MRQAQLQTIPRDRLACTDGTAGLCTGRSPETLKAARGQFAEINADETAASHIGKTTTFFETISYINSLNAGDELDELRKLLYSPGFLALLKTRSPAQIRILSRFFSGQDAGEEFAVTDDEPATHLSKTVDATPPTLEYRTEDVMHVVGPLLAPLRRYAYALTKERSAADDLVQDCLERVIRCWHQRHTGGNVRAWIFTILRNLAKSGFQQQSRRGRHASIDEEIEIRVAVPPVQEDALLHRDLMNGLRVLSVDHRETLLLISIEDMSYTDAAKILDVPVGTVRSRLSRAREKLAVYLGADSHS